MQIALGHRQAGPGAPFAPVDQGGGKLVQGQGKEESGHAQRRSSWYSHEKAILWQLVCGCLLVASRTCPGGLSAPRVCPNRLGTSGTAADGGRLAVAEWAPFSWSSQKVFAVLSQLPIVSVLPELFDAIDSHASVILQAPPGAGKSTLLPLELVRLNRLPGRIIMLEPRRLAARNIAGFLARQLGEKVGERIGLRVRGESRTSAATRLEIVTEGVLTRMLQQDPELAGVSLVIFDEFHERSLHADTALAFAIESQQGLRDDLKLLIMSATLEGMALEALLPGAPVIRSEGRGFPIDYHYRPANRQQWLEPQVGAVVLEALAAHGGSALVFLPGQGEIERLAQWLEGRLPDDVRLAPLYGRLDMAAQQAAIEPASAGSRKLVLTTNVAETSLTIEGVSVVIDSGLERRATFDLRSGVTRLETRQIARASATQRAGRAGRLGPGVCYRLWSSEVQERLAEHADLNRSYIGDLERGRAMPSLATLTKLASALGLQPSALVARFESASTGQART